MELFVHFEFVFMTFGYYAEQQRAGHVCGHENSIGERSSHSTGIGGTTADKRGFRFILSFLCSRHIMTDS